MIKQIKFNYYRKLQDFYIDFSKQINVISGENGTCKSSILHIISNSFQKIDPSKNPFVKEEDISFISQINHKLNPKIYSLTKGDKKNYSPVPDDFTGSLLSVEYFEDPALEFRKHKYPPPRYALKPYYSDGNNESLPSMLVIYLGLARLVPVGEIPDNEDKINSIEIPTKYHELIIKKYEELTGVKIRNATPNKVQSIKNRFSFETNKDGIDSNTISAGEDNLLIILSAIYSAKYYFEVTNGMPSIILIDELDATLHPSLQYEVFYLLKEISEECNSQIFFTTHSLSLLELSIKNNSNLVYLIDEGDSVYPMSSPSIEKISLFLEKKTKQEIYSDNRIPIMTEDKEARLFLRIIFDFFSENKNEFYGIPDRFELIDINLGKNNLKDLFENESLSRNLHAICILDGDDTPIYKKNIITLPGKDNPEQVAFQHLKFLLSKKEFWRQDALISQGYSISIIRTKIIPDVEHIISTRNRETAKNFFNKHKYLFSMILKDWLKDQRNKNMLDGFYDSLYGCFKRTATLNKIDPTIWNKNE